MKKTLKNQRSKQKKTLNNKNKNLSLIGGSESNNGINYEEEYKKEQEERDKEILDFSKHIRSVKIKSGKTESININESEKDLIANALEYLVKKSNEPQIHRFVYEKDHIAYLTNLDADELHSEIILSGAGTSNGDIIFIVNSDTKKTEYIYQLGKRYIKNKYGKREPIVRGYWAWPQPDTYMLTDPDPDDSNSNESDSE